MTYKNAEQQILDTFRRGAGAPAVLPIDLFPVSEAALMTKTNPFTIWKWIREGRIAAYGYKGGLKVSLAEILPRYDPKPKQER